MGSFVTRKTLEKLGPLFGIANRKLKKRVRNKLLTTAEQRNVNNAMETFDDLMADRNSGLPGASKPSALISNKRMNNAIQRIAEGKTQTQTDAVNALLQGAGVGSIIGADTVGGKKITAKNKTKVPIPRKNPTRKKPPIPRKNPTRKKPPIPKANPKTKRANRSMIVTPRKK